MDFNNLQKGKILTIVIIALIVIITAVLIWIMILANRYNKALKAGGNNLYVIPVEETWENSPKGEEISLGYAVISIDPNEIESVKRIFTGGVVIKRKGGIRFIFMEPHVEMSPEKKLSSIPQNINKKDRQEIEDIYLKIGTFEGKKDVCYTQPVSTWQFIRMDRIEREIYLGYLMSKTLNHHEGGIIIFEAPHIKGFMHREAPDTEKTMPLCEIFSKDGEIRQGVYAEFLRDEKGENEKKIKSIITSLRYTREELPEEEELKKITEEALKKLPGYVEEEKDKDEEEKEDHVGNRNYPPYEGSGELRNQNDA